MKKHLLFLAFCGISLGLYAQEITPAEAPARVRELGLASHLFDRYDNDIQFLFRFGNQKAVWRTMGTVAGARDWDRSRPDFRGGYRFSLAGGREYRHAITRWLEVRGGAELVFGRAQTQFSTPTQNVPGPVEVSDYNMRVGARLVGGVNFLIGQRVILGMEVLPGATYFWGQNQFSDAGGRLVPSRYQNFYMDIPRAPLLVSAAYRF